MKKVRDGLYIGDQLDAVNYFDEFDHVLSVNNPDFGEHAHLSEHPPDFEPDHHYGLNDGQNPQERFDAAVNKAIELIERDGDVLIHCSAGVSRSATVIITALCCVEDRSWDRIYNDVSARKYIQPSYGLVENASKHLSSRRV